VTENALFDERLAWIRRRRAASSPKDVFFLHERAEQGLAERLEDMRRPFARMLHVGCRDGVSSALLAQAARAERLILSDSCPAMPRAAPAAFPRVAAGYAALPFADGAFDLITGCAPLHHVNDVPRCLREFRRVLAPEGILLISFPAETCLYELRRAALQAEERLTGRASPRVAPFVDVKTAGMLLHHAGFSSPVADREEQIVEYPDCAALIRDLRRTGETCVLSARRPPLPRAFLPALKEEYRRAFPSSDGAGIRATFCTVTMAGVG
jgi:SAM-dependent methyltransferase